MEILAPDVTQKSKYEGEDTYHCKKKCERLSDLEIKCSAKDTMIEIIPTKSIIFSKLNRQIVKLKVYFTKISSISNHFSIFAVKSVFMEIHGHKVKFLVSRCAGALQSVEIRNARRLRRSLVWVAKCPRSRKSWAAANHLN